MQPGEVIEILTEDGWHSLPRSDVPAPGRMGRRQSSHVARVHPASQQTVDALGDHPSLRFKDEVYLVSARGLIDRLKEIDDAVSAVAHWSRSGGSLRSCQLRMAPPGA